MKFKKYIIERTMTFDMALKVFDITADVVSDTIALKKRYRDLVMQHHPDKGGDVKIAQDVNDAYAVLSKAKPMKKGGVDWDVINAKHRAWGAQIKTALLGNFDPDVFIRYFQELSGYKFFHEITKTYPLERERSPSFAGFNVEFFTKDRSSVFTFKIHANLTDVIHGSSSTLGYGDISYNVYTEAHGFHMNKKQKMSKSDWKFTRDHSFFRKPEQLFPKKKMKDIFSGKTSKRAFKKRDMETFLMKKLGATFGSGDYVRIPLGDDIFLVVYRSTFQRQAMWMINGIYKHQTREQMGPIVTFAEEEQTADIFSKIQSEVKKVKGDAKIKKAYVIAKQAYEAYKKSKGM